VFCLETGFEKASKYPDEQETDEFDAHSTAFLVRQNGSSVWAGTARLILPDCELLPIQQVYQLSNTLSLEQTGEVSRLLIIGNVRRRSAPVRSVSRRNSSEQLRWRDKAANSCKASDVLVSLVRAIAGYCVENGIPRTVFFVTPALARILRRLKIDLTEIGDSIQHRGFRIPYVVDPLQVLKTLNKLFEKELHPSNPYELFSEQGGTVYPHQLEEPFLEKIAN
jgi:N-acyl amino acid synthase of PEP-CTERM/exosortase system